MVGTEGFTRTSEPDVIDAERVESVVIRVRHLAWEEEIAVLGRLEFKPILRH